MNYTGYTPTFSQPYEIVSGSGSGSGFDFGYAPSGSGSADFANSSASIMGSGSGMPDDRTEPPVARYDEHFGQVLEINARTACTEERPDNTCYLALEQQIIAFTEEEDSASVNMSERTIETPSGRWLADAMEHFMWDSPGHAEIHGSESENLIRVNQGTADIEAGPGNDELGKSDQAGAVSYRFGAGDGIDFISKFGSDDRVIFAEGIRRDNILAFNSQETRLEAEELAHSYNLYLWPDGSPDTTLSKLDLIAFYGETSGQLVFGEDVMTAADLALLVQATSQFLCSEASGSGDICTYSTGLTVPANQPYYATLVTQAFSS